MRLRFSLRLFLIAFTLLAILLGAASHYVYRVKDESRRHKEAEAQLEKLGCTFGRWSGRPYDGKPGTLIHFARKWIDSNAFAVRTDFQNNERFSTAQAHQVLLTARELQGLEWLILNVDQVTTEITDDLHQLRELTSVTLRVKSLDIAGAGCLSNLSLKHSIEIELPLENDVALILAGDKKIQRMTFNPSNLSANTADAFRRMPLLKAIELRGAIESSQVLAALLDQPALNCLDFSHCKIDSSALVNLPANRSVRYICFEDCAPPSNFGSTLRGWSSLSNIEIESTQPTLPSSHSACNHWRCSNLHNFYVEDSTWGPKYIDLRELSVINRFEFTSEWDEQTIRDVLAAVPSCEIWFFKPAPKGERSSTGIMYNLEEGKVIKGFGFGVSRD